MYYKIILQNINFSMHCIEYISENLCEQTHDSDLWTGISFLIMTPLRTGIYLKYTLQYTLSELSSPFSLHSRRKTILLKRISFKYTWINNRSSMSKINFFIPFYSPYTQDFKRKYKELKSKNAVVFRLHALLGYQFLSTILAINPFGMGAVGLINNSQHNFWYSFVAWK